MNRAIQHYRWAHVEGTKPVLPFRSATHQPELCCSVIIITSPSLNDKVPADASPASQNVSEHRGVEQKYWAAIALLPSKSAVAVARVMQ
jgi:hypothetical protein